MLAGLLKRYIASSHLRLVKTKEAELQAGSNQPAKLSSAINNFWLSFFLGALARLENEDLNCPGPPEFTILRRDQDDYSGSLIRYDTIKAILRFWK